jgi:DNA-binding MarR family transcriptional regulator
MPLTDKYYLQINQALFSLTHAYERRMADDDEHNVLGLAVSDCSVLMVLRQFAPVNARRLSEIMDINPGTISVYVQRLVKKELVRRVRDEEDRRTWWLRLTEMGQMAAAAIVANAVAYTRDFLSALDEEEQAQLCRLLLKASHSLGYKWQ